MVEYSQFSFKYFTNIKLKHLIQCINTMRTRGCNKFRETMNNHIYLELIGLQL